MQAEGLKADRRFTEQCRWVLAQKKQEMRERSEKAARESAAAADVDGGKGDGDAPRSLIESLMRATSTGDKSFTDEEILGNVKIFFIAGSDTTSVVITWCVYHMCVSKDVQDAMQKEVDAVLGPPGKKSSSSESVGAAAVAAAAAGRLPVCAACFQEALRLNGPASFLVVSPAGKAPVTLSNGLVVRFMGMMWVMAPPWCTGSLPLYHLPWHLTTPLPLSPPLSVWKVRPGDNVNCYLDGYVVGPSCAPALLSFAGLLFRPLLCGPLNPSPFTSPYLTPTYPSFTLHMPPPSPPYPRLPGYCTAGACWTPTCTRTRTTTSPAGSAEPY